MTDEWDNLKILPTKQDLVQYTAERIVRLATATLQMNDTFSLALSGGSTPHPVYEMLADKFDQYLDWSRIHLFFGDERSVAPDDEQSNYHMVKTALLDKIDIPDTNVHRMQGEIDPQDAASAYAEDIRTFFAGHEDYFDLNLLGMGDDGHTASLFPDTDALHEDEALVIAHHVAAKGNLWRISQTFPTILKSSNIMFLVSGTGKAAALKQVLEGEYQPDVYPSQVIARSDHPHVIWAVDADAASLLS
ncbi:MAG: 6-phosphogluconolactonase [Phototrophicaceae bacterium]